MPIPDEPHLAEHRFVAGFEPVPVRGKWRSEDGEPDGCEDEEENDDDDEKE